MPIAIGVAQILEVFAATRDCVLLFGAVHVVEIGAYAVVTVAVGLQVAVLVAVGASQGDVGQIGTAGGLAAAGRQTQQAASLDGDDGIEFFAYTADQIGVGFVSLVELQDGEAIE
ncbi:hypothetical protein D3C81_1494300 [compost metagenome]